MQCPAADKDHSNHVGLFSFKFYLCHKEVRTQCRVQGGAARQEKPKPYIINDNVSSLVLLIFLVKAQQCPFLPARLRKAVYF